MIVHAKRSRLVTRTALIEAQRAAWRAVATAEDAHEAMVAAFLAACETHQALADAAFARNGCDRFDDPGERWAMAHLMEAAHALARSWRGRRPGDLSTISAAAPPVHADPATPLEVRPLEGYRFYALYPETYVDAAAALGPQPQAVTIGVRSIGAGLAALVAATVGARPPLTLRPVGHPFARTLRLHEPLPVRDRDVLIVDEGPGLSGASFAAAVKAARVSGARSVTLFPSHPNPPGTEASEANRDAWRCADRRCVPFERAFLESGRLQRWLERKLGRISPLRDVSCGAWRCGRRIAVHPFWERRKFDLEAGGRPFRAKFAGLGPEGALKLNRAEALARAGFTPKPVALVHGLLVEERASDEPAQRVETAHLARYLAFRRDAFPAEAGEGANPVALLDMLVRNAGLSLGPEAARAARALACPDADLRPIETDNRLQAVEWVETPKGPIKTDALDHCRSHDLIGCQDVLWDVVGAAVELGVDEAKLEQSLGRARPRERRFLKAAYCAFRLGEMTLAAAAHAEEAERTLAERAAQTYAAKLSAALQE